MRETIYVSAVRPLRPIRHLRWYIAGLLFLADHDQLRGPAGLQHSCSRSPERDRLVGARLRAHRHRVSAVVRRDAPGVRPHSRSHRHEARLRAGDRRLVGGRKSGHALRAHRRSDSASRDSFSASGKRRTFRRRSRPSPSGSLRASAPSRPASSRAASRSGRCSRRYRAAPRRGLGLADGVCLDRRGRSDLAGGLVAPVRRSTHRHPRLSARRAQPDYRGSGPDAAGASRARPAAATARDVRVHRFRRRWPIRSGGSTSSGCRSFSPLSMGSAAPP